MEKNKNVPMDAERKKQVVPTHKASDNFDEDTEKPYLDKGIIAEVSYDQNVERIAVVYKITRHDSISESYGKGGHLPALNAKSSSDCNKLTDNLDLTIADYFAPAACKMIILQASDADSLYRPCKFAVKRNA